ncbi:MAG: hypothetical protein ING59_15895 [Burkholderiales bacterium]|jgi:hypothetical protein|nr:hypothetical protein [Burkholderiales bacterium]
MATVNPTIRHVGNNTVVFAWVLTNVDNDGAPVGPQHADFADRSVQMAGTFGGASVRVEGTNVDPASAYFTLDDPQGADLALTAAGGKAVTEVPQWTRPFLTGGAGSSVTVSMTCRRTRGR